jgi:chromosome segregation ATPase
VTVQGERLARVEEQVNELRDKVDSMEAKLDDLLALRYKGAGAFWLAAALLGTGIIGAIGQFLHYVGLR